MYEAMINDESRPRTERQAWIVLSHCRELWRMPIDEIKRCTTTAKGFEVLVRSNGTLYTVSADREYTDVRIERNVEEVHRIMERAQSRERRRIERESTHSEKYERLSAILFPTLK